MELIFACLYDDVVRPTRKHEADAGIDLYSYSPGKYSEIYPGEAVVIKTGVTVEIPNGYFGWITNKSRNDFLVGGGIIDSGYQGELLVKVVNTHDTVLKFGHGFPVAQLLIIPCITPQLHEVSPVEIHSTKSERGDTGGIKVVFQDTAKPIEDVYSKGVPDALQKLTNYEKDLTNNDSSV